MKNAIIKITPTTNVAMIRELVHGYGFRDHDRATQNKTKPGEKREYPTQSILASFSRELSFVCSSRGGGL
jgi:hypothetical protein